MTKRIWKFPIELVGGFSIEMPAGAEVLSVQSQGRDVNLWAIVDPAAPLQRRLFWLFGTGHPLNDGGRFIGTFQVDGGRLVLHLFEAPTGEQP